MTVTLAMTALPAMKWAHAHQGTPLMQTLSGRVLDPSGAPVTGAILKFSREMQARTDADGRFFLMTPPQMPGTLSFVCQLSNGQLLQMQGLPQVRDDRLVTLAAQLPV